MPKSPARIRADEIKDYRCKNLIAVLEDPKDIRNIGTVIRNVNALGVEKTYIVDSRHALPDDWQGHAGEALAVENIRVGCQVEFCETI